MLEFLNRFIPSNECAVVHISRVKTGYQDDLSFGYRNVTIWCNKDNKYHEGSVGDGYISVAKDKARALEKHKLECKNLTKS